MSKRKSATVRRPRKSTRTARRRTSTVAASATETSDEIVDTGYVIESFPIRRIDVASSQDDADRLAKELKIARSELNPDGWGPALVRTPRSDSLMFLDSFRGALIGAGVVAGVDRFPNLEAIEQAIKAIPANILYAEHVDETRKPHGFDSETARIARLAGMRLESKSERDECDDRLVVAAASSFEGVVWPLLHLAVLAGIEVALITARDVATSPTTAQWLRPRKPMRGISREEREAVVDRFGNVLREYLAAALGDGSLVRKVGRKLQQDRDHRAYCMREALVNSPHSEFAQLSRHLRARAAKKRVCEDVIGALTESSYERIIANGRVAHQRVAPDLPYCELWPSDEPPRK